MTVQVLTQDVLVACILLGLTAVVGVLGNLLMVRALVLYRNLRVDFFLLLGSVAVADILCLVIAVPRHIIDLTSTKEPVTDAWCKTSKYLEVGTGFVATYHLVVLAALRAILLTSRGTNPPTPLQTVICAVVVWIIALLAAIPFLVIVGKFDGLCQYKTDSLDEIKKDVWLVNSFSCFVPTFIIIVFYVLAHYVSKRYFEDSYSHKEKQMSRMVSMIVGTFVFCQMPFRILDLHLLYKENEAASQDFPDEDALVSLYIAQNYLLCLMMAGKAARPVIYSKLAPELSGAFDEVINCTLCHRAYTHGRTGRSRTTSANVTANGHSGRIHSTSSDAPLTGVSDVGTSDATNVGDLTSIEELETDPL